MLSLMSSETCRDNSGGALHHLDMEVGEKIRALRKARGLSQAALGQACGVTRAAVQQWEKGVTHPNPDHLQEAAEVLGVSAGQLIGGGAEIPAPGIDASLLEDTIEAILIAKGDKPFTPASMAVACVELYALLLQRGEISESNRRDLAKDALLDTLFEQRAANHN